MTSRWLWILSQLTRRIWVRATLFSFLAIGTALVAFVISPYIPEDLPTKIGADAVDRILGIIASSMLAVTTFSLSTMVSAFSAATSNVTPRATRLVMEDTTTHNVLSTFVGSFLFSLVGIIVLSTGAYGSRGRVVLFVVTICVIILIIATLLRWIDHLSRLGRLAETTQRVEEATASALRERRRNPYLGGKPLTDPDQQISPAARPIFSSSIGYVQHVDTGELSEIARKGEGKVFVALLPGQFCVPTSPIAWAEGIANDDQEAAIRNCFSIGDTRSYDQDPRFGASVLSEIASRALSPAVNDPGTAIDVISRAVRVLAIWNEPSEARDDDVLYPGVYVPGLELEDLFDDLFTPIARDGAAIVEVCIRLQKALRDLGALDVQGRYAANARKHSRLALERAELGLNIEDDRRRVREVALEITPA